MKYFQNGLLPGLNIKALSKCLSISYILLLAGFYLCLVIVSLIPGARIERNIRDSLPLLKAEGDYRKIGGLSDIYMLNNFSDINMLNATYNIDPAKPFTSPLEGYLYYSRIETSRAASINEQMDLNASGSQRIYGTEQKARYWMGFITYLRPLLFFFNLQEIRFINQIVLFTLMAVIIAEIARQISVKIALGFAISLATVNFVIVPFSLHFSITFLIAFISSIFYLLKHKSITSNQLLIFFFIIGAATAYFDILTTPLITLGIPLILSLLMKIEDVETHHFSHVLIFILCIVISWALGFALLWVSKWVLANVILQKDIITQGLQKVSERVAGELPGYFNNEQPIFIQSITRNAANLLVSIERPMMKVFYGSVAIFTISLAFYSYFVKGIKTPMALLMIALFPYAWFIFAANHSAIHSFFTYRIQVVTSFALCSIIAYFLDFNKNTKAKIS